MIAARPVGRRTVLRLGFAGAAVLALGGGVASWMTAGYASQLDPADAPIALSAKEFAVVRALVDALFPGQDGFPAGLAIGLAQRRDDGSAAFTVPLTGYNAQMIRDAYRKQAKLLFAAGAREVLFGDVYDTRIARAQEVDRAVDAIEITPGSNTLAAPHPAGGVRMCKKPAVSVDPSVTIMGFSGIAARHVAAMV